MNARTDRVTALIVDAILNGVPQHGNASAARALAEAGVPFHVTLRVLTRPQERRSYPAYAASIATSQR